MMFNRSSAQYWIGLDLGQSHDFSAACILESHDAEPPRRYDCRHPQRWPIRSPYPTIAQEIANVAESLALSYAQERVSLAVDSTGVGQAVVDLLKREPMPHVRLIPILITGGDHE